MPNSGQFKANFEQIGPVSFRVFVTNPDGTLFSTIAECHLSQINEQAILNNFQECKSNGRFKELWSIETGTVKEEIKEEVKPEVVIETKIEAKEETIKEAIGIETEANKTI